MRRRKLLAVALARAGLTVTQDEANAARRAALASERLYESVRLGDGPPWQGRF